QSYYLVLPNKKGRTLMRPPQVQHYVPQSSFVVRRSSRHAPVLNAACGACMGDADGCDCDCGSASGSSWSAIVLRNASTIAASHCLPRPCCRIDAALLTGIAFLYGRSEVIASKLS